MIPNSFPTQNTRWRELTNTKVQALKIKEGKSRTEKEEKKRGNRSEKKERKHVLHAQRVTGKVKKHWWLDQVASSFITSFWPQIQAVSCCSVLWLDSSLWMTRHTLFSSLFLALLIERLHSTVQSPFQLFMIDRPSLIIQPVCHPLISCFTKNHVLKTGWSALAVVVRFFRR